MTAVIKLATDFDASNLVDGDVIKWDATAQKFKRAATVTANLVGNVTGNVTGLSRRTVNPDLAAAGTVLADAAQLLEGFTVVTGADGTKGVKLPATPVAGTEVWIKGTTAGVLKVWPDAAATINAIGANGAISLTTGAMPAMFIAKSPTQWYSFPLVAS
jgi:hypothetical protein